MSHGEKQAPTLSQDELDSVLNHCEGTHKLRDKSIILISHTMGLRAKELAALRIGDVLDKRKGTLKEIIQLERSQTKGKKARKVPLLDDYTREILVAYIEERRNSWEIVTDESPLFRSQKSHVKVGEDQGYFSANSMQRLIRHIYIRAGVKASSHSGRRTYASTLIQSGVDIHRIMVLMGHSSITTTQRYFQTNDYLLMQAALKVKIQRPSS